MAGGATSLQTTLAAWSDELCSRLEGRSGADLASAEIPRRRALEAARWRALGAERICLRAAGDGSGFAAEIPLEVHLEPADDRAVVSAAARARAEGWAALVVAPRDLAAAARALWNSGTRVVAPVGGARGEELVSVKLFAASEALKLGADEIDYYASPSIAPDDSEAARPAGADELGALDQLCRRAGAAWKLVWPVEWDSRWPPAAAFASPLYGPLIGRVKIAPAGANGVGAVFARGGGA